MKAKMQPSAVGIVLLLAVPLAGGGCDRYGPTIDLDGRPPAKTDGTWRVSWLIQRHETSEPVSCSQAGAAHVLVRTSAPSEPVSSKTYRVACDLAAKEAWIPIGAGRTTVSALLVDGGGRTLSATGEQTLAAATTGSALATPLLFEVK